MIEQTCELLEKYGFFRKYQYLDNEVCEMLIAEYCKGPMMNECKRKEYRLKNVVPPSDDMLPDGEMLE